MTYILPVPEFKATDFSGLGEIGQLYTAARKAAADQDLARANAETQKKYADNQDKKLSAEMKRQEWQDKRTVEQDAYTKSKDAAEMAVPGSPVMRAAQNSLGLGNAAGKPYGISFEEQTDKPPSIAPTTNPLFRAMFPKNLAADALAKPLDETEEGIKKGELYGPPAPDEPVDMTTNPHIDDATTELESQAPPMKHMYAKFGGDRFEVPKGDGQVLGEEKYDQLYGRFIAQGDKPEIAQAKVLQMRGQDIGAAGKGASLEQKRQTQLTRGEQLGAKDAALGQSDVNNIRNNDARLAAARLFSNGMPAASKEQGVAMSALNSRITQIRNVASWNKLVEMDKTADMLAHDVESGSVPLQNREAQVLAAKIVRGRVTDTEMRQLYDNIGGASDTFSRLAHNTGLGELSPEQLNQLRRSTAVILNTHRMALDRAKEVIKQGLGPRTFGQMPDQAQQAADMMFAEIGSSPEDLFDVQGGVQPGAHQQGKVTPKPRPTARPPAAPGPPAVSPQTKVVGGKTYYKVQGGWSDAPPQ